MRLLLLILAALLGVILPVQAQSPTQSAPPKSAQRDLAFEGEPSARPGEAHLTPTIPRSYALVVGIGNYKSLPPQAQLRFAERDAEAIYSVLISPEGGNFRAENVRRLTGPAATLDNLKRALEEWLPSVTQPEDRVLVYFAGHGFIHQGRAYLAPYDIDPDRISETGYPMDRFGGVFGGRVKGKWKVLLTDACHSGAISPDAEIPALNRQLLSAAQSLFSLTASRDREQSFESEDWGGGHGIFTYYVVKGLEGEADESRDGIVTADELAEYVRRNVREATGGRQNPTSERGSYDPDMMLAYVPSNRSPASPPPPKYGTLIFESNLDGVEVFINGKSAGSVSRNAPLRVPGLQPGIVTIRAVRQGYEPDGPREEMVYPGQESVVTIRILIPRRRPRAASDLFDEGLEYYNRGLEKNYRAAADRFLRALEIDPRFPQVALYLGRTYDALFDQETAKKYFQLAIEIDPGYLEARSSYAGMLLSLGDVDEAVRQLNFVTQRDRSDAFSLYLLAQAYRMKNMFRESITAAQKAVAIRPQLAEAHFWLAESLRMSGENERSNHEYLEYLRLSDYDSKLAGRINYYALGFLAGLGRKKRAAQRDIWSDLRSLAYFGLCDNSRLLKDYASAIAYCQTSLRYDPEDAYTHYVLALAYARRAQLTGSVEELAAARKHFRAVLQLNPDITEAQYARQNIAAIEQNLRAN